MWSVLHLGVPGRGAGGTHPFEHGCLLAIQDGSHDGHQPQRVPAEGVLGRGTQIGGVRGDTLLLAPSHPTHNTWTR